ncbi:MAG: septum formation protein Maf [Candidatus Scalindua sp. AMX11]|nr:MAG: septum formation protein Maf [Candidatus Scalindua sp.]NOG84593.1 septum formation protein Maf [Planctomycetota bacterium]RZV92367.1 MAG: septum formation protein Maf [Candidatus Scalindua sp. SCAELEC01]TDE66108.1 MAG: septum formation protein Maf [Candidatus Scalindua sp. AMX11]GJQ59081.1 MAG: septum formation inhibitor Maf [Candidatus Scalindua sp.]
MKSLYLASSSPRREQILKEMGFDFIVSPPIHFIEKESGGETEALVCHNARGKAREVAARYSDSIIIGCDTIVTLHKEIFGKPFTSGKAYAMLERLSGNWHNVLTGLAVIDTESGRELVGYEKTEVKFKSLSKNEIADYVKSGEPLDKAGAYGIQGYGRAFVEEIKGNISTVIGLSKGLLLKFLSELGIRV